MSAANRRQWIAVAIALGLLAAGCDVDREVAVAHGMNPPTETFEQLPITNPDFMLPSQAGSPVAAILGRAGPISSAIVFSFDGPRLNMWRLVSTPPYLTIGVAPGPTVAPDWATANAGLSGWCRPWNCVLVQVGWDGEAAVAVVNVVKEGHRVGARAARAMWVSSVIEPLDGSPAMLCMDELGAVEILPGPNETIVAVHPRDRSDFSSRTDAAIELWSCGYPTIGGACPGEEVDPVERIVEWPACSCIYRETVHVPRKCYPAPQPDAVVSDGSGEASTR